MDKRFKIFFSALFLTTLLPYFPYLFRFIPRQLLGFNLTGWAWLIMLFVTLFSFAYPRKNSFPYFIWLPWLLYLFIYLIVDFSFLGLQLTLQYALPLLIGILASTFNYDLENLTWLFKWLKRLSICIYLLFIFGFFFRGGYGPSYAASVMFFTCMVSLLSSLYFMTYEPQYLLYILIIFLVSFVEGARMGIAATAAIFLLHFANKKINTKLLFGFIGAMALLLVFNSTRFQEMTFKGGKGEMSDLTLNYYENTKIKSSGRITWKKALDPGLKASPVWGNGPRADNAQLIKITGRSYGEAHNDYLAVRYNYGYVGLAMLLLGFIGNFLYLFRISRQYTMNDLIWLLSTTALTLFISFMMFMYTDNILKYTIYFPNYFFAMIGIVCSLKRNEDLSNYSLV